MKTLTLKIRARLGNSFINEVYHFYDSNSTQVIEYNSNFNADELVRLITTLKCCNVLFDYYEDLNGKVLFDLYRRDVLNKECIKDIVDDLITRIYVKFQYQTFQHALFQLMDCFANRNDITFELNVKN